MIEPRLKRQETLVGQLLGVAQLHDKDFEAGDPAFELERFDRAEFSGYGAGHSDG